MSARNRFISLNKHIFQSSFGESLWAKCVHTCSTTLFAKIDALFLNARNLSTTSAHPLNVSLEMFEILNIR